MLNARSAAPRATMPLPSLVIPLPPSLTIFIHFSPSFSVSLRLSTPLIFALIIPLRVHFLRSLSPLLRSQSPDIYGIFFIARSLHSALLARVLSPVSSRLVSSRLISARLGSSPEAPGTRERFNLHYRRCQRDSRCAKLRPGFVAAVREPSISRRRSISAE